jgi:hypothetical protein
VIRLKKVARLIAFARILVANISDGINHAIGYHGETEESRNATFR